MDKKNEKVRNMLNSFPGESDLWERLCLSNMENICRCSGAKIIHKGDVEGYELCILNTKYNFYKNKDIVPEIHPHLKFLSLLYMVESQDIIPTGKLRAMHELKGGQFFFQGGHELPLLVIAKKFAKDIDGFNKKGMSIGGIKSVYGDASIILYPFPKIPLTYILWQEDDEFPARVNILFDETIEKHLVLEGIWGTAFFTTRQFFT